MFDYRKKKRRMISGNKKKEESILQEERFSFPEDRDVHLADKLQADADHINYVKKPWAKRSIMSIVLSIVAAVWFVLSILMMMRTLGQPQLYISGIVCCCIVCAAVGFWYGIIALLEKDKNYLLAYIGMALSGIQLVLIILAMIAGGRS